MNNVEETISEMKEIAVCLWQNDEQAYKKLAEQMGRWRRTLQEMLDYLAQMQSQGKEVPLAVIFQQLENFNLALQKKDDFMLADVLEFELAEALNYYKGIVEIYG